MTNYNLPLYQNVPQMWDEKKCAKHAKSIWRDGMGTPIGFPGYISGGPHGFGGIRYNGGCIRDGEWWQGETNPLPVVTDNYEWTWVSSWGWRLIAKKAA